MVTQERDVLGPDPDVVEPLLARVLREEEAPEVPEVFAPAEGPPPELRGLGVARHHPLGHQTPQRVAHGEVVLRDPGVDRLLDDRGLALLALGVAAEAPRHGSIGILDDLLVDLPGEAHRVVLARAEIDHAAADHGHPRPEGLLGERDLGDGRGRDGLGRPLGRRGRLGFLAQFIIGQRFGAHAATPFAPSGASAPGRAWRERG